MKSDLFKCLNIQNIFSLVCVLGCSIQINYIFTRYFKSEIISIVTIEIPDKTTLPDITFCFEKLKSINFTKLKAFHPNVKLPDNLPDIIANLPNRRDDTKTQHHTISDILAKHLTINETTNLLFEPDQIFHQIRILPHRSNSSEFKDYCRFNKFYYQNYFCIMFVCSSDIQVHVEEVNFYPGYIFLMHIVLDHKFSKRFRKIRVSFVEKGGIPASRQLKWLPIRTEKTPTAHILNFFSVKTKMLPFPGYSCVNYNETGFETRDEKLVNCLNRLSLEKFGQIFHSTPVLADSNLRFATSDQLFDPNYQKTVDQILSRCEKEAIQYDCSSERYIIKTRVPVKSPNQFTHILFEPTKSPNIETRAQRAITFLDCVIAVGGVFNFWFSFAINVHIPKGIRLIHKKCKSLTNKPKSHSKKDNNFQCYTQKLIVHTDKPFKVYTIDKTWSGPTVDLKPLKAKISNLPNEKFISTYH